MVDRNRELVPDNWSLVRESADHRTLFEGWYSYALHPVSQKLPQHRLWNSSSVRLIDDGPLSSFQGRLSSASSFYTSIGDWWCDVLGFVLVGSVSSFSTLKIFWEASHLWGLLCPPVYLLGRFPSLQHVQGSTPTGIFKGGCQPLTHPSLGFPFCFSLFWIHGDGMCGLTVTSWGNQAEDMGDCFHLHCQAGGWDHIGCTVFMDGSRTLLDSEAPPWLVFGDWAISVH